MHDAYEVVKGAQENHSPMRVLRNQVAVETSVLNSFTDVFRPNVAALGKVGNRSSDFQNAVVCPRGESEFCNRVLHQFFPCLINLAEFANLFRLHVGVGEQSFSSGKSLSNESVPTSPRFLCSKVLCTSLRGHQYANQYLSSSGPEILAMYF
jgi:hypothetical protein